MVGEWQTATIEEIAEKVGMGPFGSSIRVSTFVDKGIPVISGQHLHSTRLSDSEYNFITPEHAEKLKNANVYRGDVIFTHAGNIGQAAYIPETSKFGHYVISQRQFYMRCDRSKVIPEFIAYFFKSAEGKHKLLANTSQTGVPSIARPVSYLRTIELLLPPLPEQRTIAAILGALDDKIELNRQMNKTLEEMARAIFKSWFVDFETFRDQGMQDSPMGPIPRGWRVGKLNNIASFVKGVSYRSDDLQESTVALVTLKSVARGGGYQQEGLKPYIGEYKPEQQLQPGELIVAHTDLTQAAEVLGRTARVQAHSQFPTLVASLDLVIVRPMGQATSNEFLYSMLSRSEFQEHAYGYANGTTVLHLSAKALPEYQCILPAPTIIETFTRLVRPIYERIDYNEAQSHTLAAVRDTLLPKLLSGDIRVKDAEKFVEVKL